ncbi:MAG: transposase, partial [Desulfosalsimonas sp.]
MSAPSIYFRTSQLLACYSVTDTKLSEEQIARQYGKRQDTEIFFKMCKQHLKLVNQIKIRDFD